MKQVQIRFAGDNKYITKRRGILPMFGYQGQFFIADVTGGGGGGTATSVRRNLPFNAFGSGRKLATARGNHGDRARRSTVGRPQSQKEVWHQALGCCYQK